MKDIIQRIQARAYDIRDIDLLDITHFKLSDCVVSMNELKAIKSLIDYSIENVKEQEKNNLIYQLYHFWLDYGIIDYSDFTKEDLLKEVTDNVKNDINKEIENLTNTLENWEEDTQEYKNITRLLKECKGIM